MPELHKENVFETEVVEHLTANGWLEGEWQNYDRERALYTEDLLWWLREQNPKEWQKLSIRDEDEKEKAVIARACEEMDKNGSLYVLRHGLKHLNAKFHVCQFKPSSGLNEQIIARYKAVRCRVVRQVHYSTSNEKSIDLVFFVNGIPVATAELKTDFTQNVQDAIRQYKNDRYPRDKETRREEPLLAFKRRALVHFAVSSDEVYMTTELKGSDTYFLPFNRGFDDGAGNPPNADGYRTAYLWESVLQRDNWLKVLGRFVHLEKEEKKDDQGRKKVSEKLIFPRFHQLEAVNRLIDAARTEGSGQKYLIQHSAGSGKSNSIAWLAHQLSDLHNGEATVFDSIIVVTDRRILDQQIRDTIRQFAQVGATVGHAEHSGDLRRFIAEGKKIIISTVQKFPFILDELSDLSGRKFALLIDEAHSSQGGKTTGRMHEVLGGKADEEETFEEDATQDAVNAEIERRISSRRMLSNASYFAFTATPKNKTLELFGEKIVVGDKVQFRSPEELTYTTKQAIQEKFILDVVANYTTYDSFYQVAKTVADDPEFDKVKALKKIRHYVESHDKAIRRKAEIMVDHFVAQVAGKQKVGGKARAMIVCNGIARAIDYFRVVSDYLDKIKSPYKAIVAYSGDFEIGGVKKTEADLNGFPSKDIPARLKQDPYRFLIVANKFVTGFDEPLLHSMYVDKPLAGVLAVQTLSRLNRAHPQKHDTFVLDFADNAEAVKAAFQDYYRATIQLGETNADKLHDLKAVLDASQVYAWAQVERWVELYLGGAEREELDPILDLCVEAYAELDEDGQVEFKGSAKSFVRSYGFLAAILNYGHVSWEKLSIFLNFLIPKLPSPKEEDLSKGVLDAIDMDSYRVEAKAAVEMAMEDSDATVEPIPPDPGPRKPEPEIDKLSSIIKAFNELFGNIEWKDEDKILKVIAEEIPARVAQDKAYRNAQLHSDRDGARLEHDLVLKRVVTELLFDHTELYKQFFENASFKRWMTDMVFDATYHPAAMPPKAGRGGEARP